MYAVLETGGKQYKVQEGDFIFVEKLDGAEGEDVKFSNVLVYSNEGELKVGTPYIDGAEVSGTIVKNGKGKKILVFKYNAKKNYRRRQGHRQPYTKVQINKISA